VSSSIPLIESIPQTLCSKESGSEDTAMNSHLVLSAGAWPAMLYQNMEANPHQPDEGFLMNRMLITVLSSCIFSTDSLTLFTDVQGYLSTARGRKPGPEASCNSSSHHLRRSAREFYSAGHNTRSFLRNRLYPPSLRRTNILTASFIVSYRSPWSSIDMKCGIRNCYDGGQGALTQSPTMEKIRSSFSSQTGRLEGPQHAGLLARVC
jgi:hypothetical protein